MGKTIVKAKFTNRDDMAVADRGFISKDQIRFMEVEALVDTGAMLVSLPKKIATQLGLKVMERKPVNYANGRQELKEIAGGLLVEIQGRLAEARCIIEPRLKTILIGQIVLEDMDWAVNPSKRCLIPAHEGYEQGVVEMY